MNIDQPIGVVVLPIEMFKMHQDNAEFKTEISRRSEIERLAEKQFGFIYGRLRVYECEWVFSREARSNHVIPTHIHRATNEYSVCLHEQRQFRP